MTAAGWRVRYDPGAQVSHAEPDRWGAVLARRFPYGTSAAPLSRRHPGQVPPLVLQAWPAAAVAALLARRPIEAGRLDGAGTGQLVWLLRGWGVPARGVPCARWPGRCGRRGSGRASGPSSTRCPWWPRASLFPAAARGGSGRRRLALASLLIGPPATAWLRARPDLDPVRFGLGYLADEAAYGAGVCRGAAAERLAEPLRPRLAWRPLPRAAKHR